MIDEREEERPRLLFTIGDVAGIGPEILVAGWPYLVALCRPVVVGEASWLQRYGELKIVGPDDEATPEQIPLLPASSVALDDVPVGQVSAAAGRAAYDFLCAAIDETLAGRAAGIVTCPLHKEGLRAAGIPHPGHTEILAERTGSNSHAMILYADGVAVAHVTLHMALREIFASLTTEAILERIELLDRLLPRLVARPGRIGVAGLNPHAGDGGLFGNEETTLIEPAVEEARRRGIDASGPWPADTLFVRADREQFDGIVAMYHDQGHIAMKLRSGFRCVNITAGLPIVRTSVAHGTAYDIAGRGLADPASLIAATQVAVRLVEGTATTTG
ncbi:MAG: 4-hydroxythreonine-4-phosphate dehydrogenase PdxA [Gemmataceae bacterium]